MPDNDDSVDLNVRLARQLGLPDNPTQDDWAAHAVKQADPEDLKIAQDMLLSAKSDEQDAGYSDETSNPYRIFLEYIMEALHSGDYTTDREAHKQGEYEHLLTVEGIDLAATFLINYGGCDPERAHATLERAIAAQT